MNVNQTPDEEDIDIKVGDEIPVEDETAYKAEKVEPDVVDALRNLGLQFGETVRAAWESEERRNFEAEMREGVIAFSDGAEKAFKEFMEGNTAQKVKSEASDFKTKTESTDWAQKSQVTLSRGLQSLSDELAKLANSFTPQQKEPPAEEEPSDES
jgi:hypothetical protein